jgi:hypothetical protein
VAVFVQVGREGFVIGAGGLHAGMRLFDPQLREPVTELREAFGVVGKDFVSKLSAFADEAGVELELRDRVVKGS